MAGTHFISIETLNGIVTKVDGQISTSVQAWWKGNSDFVNQEVTGVMNKFADEGYVLINNEEIDGRIIYRFEHKDY